MPVCVGREGYSPAVSVLRKGWRAASCGLGAIEMS